MVLCVHGLITSGKVVGKHLETIVRKKTSMDPVSLILEIPYMVCYLFSPVKNPFWTAKIRKFTVEFLYKVTDFCGPGWAG